MIRNISLLVIAALLLSTLSCSFFHRMETRIDHFLDRIQNLLDSWDEKGLLPHAIAERLRNAIQEARENWQNGKEKLLGILRQVLDLFLATSVVGVQTPEQTEAEGG